MGFLLRGRRGASLILAAILWVSVSPSAQAAGTNDRTAASWAGVSSSALAVEASGRRVVGFAKEKHTLGAYYDSSTSQFVVVIPASGSESRVSVTDFAKFGVPVRFERRNITRTQIDMINQRIIGLAWHPEASRYAYGFDYDLRRGVFDIRTNAPAQVISPLISAYPGLIEYTYGVTKSQTRGDDSDPHWGGAVIKDFVTQPCTSGFEVQDASGTKYMVTAGHCYPTNTTVYSGAGTYYFGTVGNRSTANPDLELMSGSSYQGYIYRGATSQPEYGSPVLSAGDGVVGVTSYCVSGAVGLELCNKTLLSDSASYYDAGTWHDHLYKYSGGGLTQNGDSGAPFYIPADAPTLGVHIRGMHTALSGNIMYGEKWSTISAGIAFPVSIVTG